MMERFTNLVNFATSVMFRVFLAQDTAVSLTIHSPDILAVHVAPVFILIYFQTCSRLAFSSTVTSVF